MIELYSKVLHDRRVNISVNEEGLIIAQVDGRSVVLRGLGQTKVNTEAEFQQLKGLLEKRKIVLQGQVLELEKRNLGGWGREIHSGRDNKKENKFKGTYDWVIDLLRDQQKEDLSDDQYLAEIVAKACNAVDDVLGGWSPYPVIGCPGRHFNANGKTEPDSRIVYASRHFNQAIELFCEKGASFRNRYYKELGWGLHSMQDIFAHDLSYTTGDFAFVKNVPHHVNKFGAAADNPYHNRAGYFGVTDDGKGGGGYSDLTVRYFDTRAITYIYLMFFRIAIEENKETITGKLIPQLNTLLSCDNQGVYVAKVLDVLSQIFDKTPDGFIVRGEYWQTQLSCAIPIIKDFNRHPGTPDDKAQSVTGLLFTVQKIDKSAEKINAVKTLTMEDIYKTNTKFFDLFRFVGNSVSKPFFGEFLKQIPTINAAIEVTAEGVILVKQEMQKYLEELQPQEQDVMHFEELLRHILVNESKGLRGEAISYLIKATVGVRELETELNYDSIELASAYFTIGAYLFDQHMFDAASSAFQQALDILDRCRRDKSKKLSVIEVNELEAKIYFAKARISFSTRKDYDLAIQYLQLSLNRQGDSNDILLKYEKQRHIAVAHIRMGKHAKAKEAIDAIIKSCECYANTSTLKQKTIALFIVSKCQINLAHIYYFGGNYKDALSTLQSVVSSLASREQETQCFDKIILAKTLLAKTHLHLKNYPMAEKYFKEITDSISGRQDANGCYYIQTSASVLREYVSSCCNLAIILDDSEQAKQCVQTMLNNLRVLSNNTHVYSEDTMRRWSLFDKKFQKLLNAKLMGIEEYYEFFPAQQQLVENSDDQIVAKEPPRKKPRTVSPAKSHVHVLNPTQGYNTIFNQPRFSAINDEWRYDNETITTLLDHYIDDVSIRKLTPLDLMQNSGATLAQNLQGSHLEAILQESRTGLQTQALLLPIRVNRNHWVALSIYFSDENREKPIISYLDPFGTYPQEDLIKIISAAFPNSGIIASPLRIQHDSYNCGPCVVAALVYMLQHGGNLPRSVEEIGDLGQVRETQKEILEMLSSTKVVP